MNYNEIGNYGFQYKDLSKLSGLMKHDFLVMYTEKLQAHAKKMEGELLEVREARSKDGNRFYQADAKRIMQENDNLRQTIFTQDRQLIAKDQEIKYLKQLIKDMQTGASIEPSRSNPDDHRRGRKRGSDGKLLPSAVPLAIREKQCYQMIELNGMSIEDVAAELDILPGTAKDYKNSYIRKQKKQAADKRAKASELARLHSEEQAYLDYMASCNVILG